MILDEVVWRVRPIGHHDGDRVAGESLEAVANREPETTWILRFHVTDSGIALGQVSHLPGRVAGAVVVHDQALEVDALAIEGRRGRRKVGRDRTCLVVGRYDDRQLQAATDHVSTLRS